MERVTGIGGVFLRARDPEALAAWYAEHLGVPIDAGQTYGTFTAGGTGAAGETDGPEQTVWSAFPPDTEYLGEGEPAFMVNYRVADLDAMRAQLRAAGADVDERVENHAYGRFGWATDPEGNRFELWQPAGPGF